MEDQPRNSGINTVGAIPWGTHFCLFYETKNDLIDLLIPYFRAGLKNSELCIWTIPEPFEVEEAIKNLRKAIPDFDVYFEKKQIEIVPYTACCIKDTFFDSQKALAYWKEKLSLALENGYSGLRLVEDRFWMEKTALKDFLTYEKKINYFTNKNKMLVLCPYRLEATSPEVIIDAVSNHQISLIKKKGKWEKTENFGWKTAEKELYESEEKYKAFFESSIDAVLLTSPDGKIYAANPEACRVFGRSEEELIQTGRNGIIDVSDPRLKPALEEREKTGKFKGELNFRRENGTIFPGEVSSALFTDKNGFVKTAMMIRDVTERNRAEEALRLGEKKYRLLFNTMSEGILFGEILFGEKGQPTDFLCLDINPAFETQTGLSREKVMGRKIREVLPNLEDTWIERYAKTALTGEAAHFVSYARDLGHWYEVYTFSPAKGQFYAVFFNITERKRAEEALHESEKKYRTLFETMQEGFFIADIITNEAGEPVDFRTLEANRAFETQTGLPPNQFIGITALELYPGLDPFWIQTYGRVALTGEPVHFEYNLNILNCYYEVSAYQVRPGRFAAIFLDITDRKQAEEKLRKSENEFRALAENSPDIILRFNKEKRHTYANPAALEAYGLSEEEVIGKSHFELGRSPEQIKLWEKWHKKVFATGRPETIEVSYKSSQGKEYNFNAKIVPEFADGKVASILAICRDITDIKKAEARLRETLDNLEIIVYERTLELEKAYRSLKESKESLAEAQRIAHIGNWERNLVTGKITWSEEMFRIFGIEPGEFGADYNSFLNYVHPEDRACVDKAVQEAFSGKPFSIDYRLIRKDGEERIAHAEGEVILDEKNKPVLIRGTVQDITERKKEEERTRYLANIVESSNDGIITKSLEGIITSWNKGAVHIYGYTPEEILGNSISMLELPELGGEMSKLTEQIEQGQSIQQYETIRLRKDGQKIHVSLTLSPVLDRKGRLTAVSVISRDITKRKKAEEALAKIEAARLKEIHHRIKNNLQVISSLLDLEVGKFNARERIENSEVLRAFRESQDRVISIALIHEELYEGEGTEALNFSLYLQKLAENLFQTYKVGDSQKVSLKMELVENIFFDMDTAVPLGLIVNELVSNSLKHAFSDAQTKDMGEIKIKLYREGNLKVVEEAAYIKTCEKNRQEEKKKQFENIPYLLTVSDNGIGIPESFSLEDSETLGLQLITLLVKQLDGELKLRRNSGTEFTMRFAVQQRNQEFSE